MYLAIFIDDGLIAAKSKCVLDSVIKVLRNSYEITIGDTSLFVGLQIKRNRKEKTMFLHQRTYLEHVIEKFGINDAKIVSVPADPHVRLRPVDTEEVNRSKIPFRKAVGSLMFLAIVSRPDIAYSVNAFSKYLNNYDESHWLAVKRIVKYLKGTLDLGIRYGSGKSLLQVVGYSDADYANDIETRRSTTGYVFMLVNGPVTWSSQRQKLVTLSTTEQNMWRPLLRQKR